MSFRTPLLTANNGSARETILAPVTQQILTPRSLFAFPREIRDQFYHEIFQAQDPFEVYVPAKPHQMTGDKNHIVFVVSYIPQDFAAMVNFDHHRPRDMAWLLSNKKIWQEATEQFHRQAIWTVLDTTFRGAFEKTSHWSQPYQFHPTTLQPRLFVPISAQHIVVHDPIAVIPRPEWRWDGKANWHIQTDWHFIDRLVAGLQNTANLQTLVISLRTDIYPTQEDALKQAPADVSVRTSLGRLHSFTAPNLRKMEFKVNYTAAFEARADFVLALEEHFDEVGMDLIGGKGDRACLEISTLPREAVYTYTRSREG